MTEPNVELKIENNKGKGLVIIVILLLIVSLTLGGYIVYDKFINNKKEEEKNETNNSEVKENNEAVDNEKNEIDNLVVGDTTKTLVSKEISLLIEKYELNSILWKYEKASAIDYTKLSKQSMSNISKKAMVQVMINSASDESFVYNVFTETGTEIELTKEEDEFRDSVVSTAYMYISDFNKYIKDVFKSDIVINNDDKSFDFNSCPSMHVFKDKIYLSYQCGYTGGPINDIYTSLVKNENTIYLYGVKIIDEEDEFKLTRVKYKFEYNGKIWNLKEVEPLEVIQ